MVRLICCYGAFFLFYAGLLHCRHLKTVRTHLSGLVSESVSESVDSSKRLTEGVWRSYQSGADVSQRDVQFLIPSSAVIKMLLNFFYALRVLLSVLPFAIFVCTRII